jgi:acyl-CoA thioester hydrolase
MSNTNRETLESYPFQVEQPVAWGDMDAMQHVNNVTYFRYMETARVSFLQQVGFMAYAAEHQVGLLVAEQSCKYVRAVTYPDILIVGVKLAEIKEEWFELKYLITSKQLNGVAAIGSSKIVAWNIRDQQKMTMPNLLATALNEMHGKGGGS